MYFLENIIAITATLIMIPSNQKRESTKQMRDLTLEVDTKPSLTIKFLTGNNIFKRIKIILNNTISPQSINYTNRSHNQYTSILKSLYCQYQLILRYQATFNQTCRII